MKIPKTSFVTLLVLLNAVPVYGVFAWDWSSFDLIFLYWLENIIIGIFAVVRFLSRRYRHPAEIVHPLFLALFFSVHYGMFCYGHGKFVISFFGKEVLGELATQGVYEIILPVIDSRHLFWPVAALFIYQVLDWVRDASKRGLGITDIKDLMVAPYRRIIVLHISIIASGIALSAMNEPVAGLLILIVMKTAFDLYHWKKDEQGTQLVGGQLTNETIRHNVDHLQDQSNKSEW